MTFYEKILKGLQEAVNYSKGKGNAIIHRYETKK